MNPAILKMVKVVINFTNFKSVTIPYLSEVHDGPFITMNICWNTKKYGIGIVDNIQVVDGNKLYNVEVPKGLELFDGCNLGVSYPNQIFIDTAKKTNIISMSFCMDTLPDDMDKFINEIIDGIDDAHHPVIQSILNGFYKSDQGGYK